VDYGAVPKGCRRFVVPLRMRGEQDYVIPIETSAHAAGGLWVWLLGGGSAIQFLGDEMIWVPELSGSLVCDSRKVAATWRSEIRGQDRLPDDKDTEFCVCMAGKEFFGCGGPPQTGCSSGREQEDDARIVCRGVKRALECAEVGL
jgi:hypothetical protein